MLPWQPHFEPHSSWIQKGVTMVTWLKYSKECFHYFDRINLSGVSDENLLAFVNFNQYTCTCT